jgi:hypothetical protein
MRLAPQAGGCRVQLRRGEKSLEEVFVPRSKIIDHSDEVLLSHRPGIGEDPDRRNSSSSARRNISHALGSDAPDREGRHRGCRGCRAQRSHSGGRDARLRRCREYSPEDEVIKTTRGDHAGCLARVVHRAADEKTARHERTHSRGGDPVRRKVQSMGPCGKRHVKAIVYEDSRRRSSHGFDTPRHELGERCAFEIALTNLHEVDVRAGRSTDEPDKASAPIGFARAGRETVAIGDEAENRRHGKQLFAVAERRAKR